MRDINKHIIEPRCRAEGKSYNRSLNPNGLKVDAFITHCWDEPFFDFVDSTKNALHPFPTKPNLWICAFALMQGKSKIVEEQLEMSLDNHPLSWLSVLPNRLWWSEILKQICTAAFGVLVN